MVNVLKWEQGISEQCIIHYESIILCLMKNVHINTALLLPELQRNKIKSESTLLGEINVKKCEPPRVKASIMDN